MDEEVPVRSYSYQELEHRARNEELPRATGPRRTQHKGDEKAIAVKRSRAFAMKLEDREG
jgi:hypothetical protein